MFKQIRTTGLAMMLAAINMAALAGAARAEAGEACLAPGAVRDADVQRNAAQLGPDSGLCISTLDFEENGLTWQLTVIENTGQRDAPTIYLPHDDEESAFDTALYGVRKYGGKLVAVEAGDSRHFKGQDPNRNFGMTRETTASCADMKTRPAPLFTRFLLDLRHPRIGFFLTMHNNADGHTGNGGSGGISAARSGGVMTGMMAKGDEDDAVLLAGRKPFAQEKRARRTAEFFLERGINVIYEHVTPEGNDCSFSNYVVLNDLGEYFNIEAQHGHTQQQKHMLDQMMTFHRIRVRDRSIR
jgi:hypothetical protein